MSAGRILFVCLGNICRSPTAEAVLRAMAQARGLDLVVESAGTGGYHIGADPDPRSRRVAEARGYDFTGQVSRKLSAQDFSDFDLILCMDQANLHDTRAVMPEGARAKVRRFLDYAVDQDLRDVPDPYYENNFEQVLDLIELGVGRVLDAET
ncbi:low molecular weight protein-tyrosine-phosphatase [Amylibacter marinus]|nr:low molecular weight protein-tyrosine-phosphatase [Amylibacter marinus]